MQEKYFRLYSCSLPVMGKDQSIVCNLHNAGYTIVPQFLAEILLEYPDLSIKELEDLYGDREGSILQYFNYLEEKQLGFFTVEPELFPRLELDWYSPERLKHGVVQIADLNRFNYGDIIHSLIETDCINIDIWFTGEVKAEAIESLLIPFNTSSVRSFDLYIPFSNHNTPEKLAKLGNNALKAADMVVYGAPSKKKIRQDRIYYTPRKLNDNKKAFKNIPADKFIIYIEFFMESIKHNPFYNRKVCIDEHGFIKNCLTHKREFGNISSTELSSLPDNEEFTDLWYACNDKIEDVRDSPFRYIWLNTHELEKVDNQLYRMIP
jgi:SPASM domain peptide maturase of grasp-with-spasm system